MMDKVTRKIDNDGYETEYVDHWDIIHKLDELVDVQNEKDREIKRIYEMLTEISINQYKQLKAIQEAGWRVR